jgi:hypothetical protein
VQPIIKNAEFELMNEIVKPDAKKRLSLGGAVMEEAAAYNVYRNQLGQIVLDPVKAVPAYETWIYENPKVLASIKRGLADSAKGRTIKLGSFARHARSRA